MGKDEANSESSQYKDKDKANSRSWAAKNKAAGELTESKTTPTADRLAQRRTRPTMDHYWRGEGRGQRRIVARTTKDKVSGGRILTRTTKDETNGGS